MFSWRHVVCCGFLIAVGLGRLVYAADLPSRFEFCGEGEPKRHLRIAIYDELQDPWNVVLTTNGRNEPAKVTPYIFGNVTPREGFLIAILPKAKTPPILIFDDGHAEWAGKFYFPCR
ncbi:MAG: hypothetical protein EBU34_13155 [Alphaproteobacteria bacterium]|jgi:hypothetical protein|nr:hypothetical protein [Alphaproteobacteria bacterium]